MYDDDIRQVPSQFTQAFRSFANLVQGELKLARAEMSENVSRAGVGLAFFGVAALFALVTFNILATAIVATLAENGLSYGLAAAIVGGALLIIAAIFAIMGKSRLNAEALKPKRTMAAVERDIQTIKEATHV